MAKESYKNKEAAVKAQEAQKEVVVNAKAALTKYLKKNDLARDKDHTKDKKHGTKIKEFNLEINKANEKLIAINTAVASFKEGKEKKAGKEGKEKKGSKGAVAKYDYPDGLTSEEKKKWRVAARKGSTDPKELLKAAKADKVVKEKKEKAPKEDKKADKAKDSKKGKKEEAAPAKEEKSSKKDKSKGKDKKKAKKSND